MAGFTINGCGAADSYYPLKELGAFHCPKCNSTRLFSLMELKMKIRVLYIPTFTINTKYAVTCTVCENGYYVDEVTKNAILNGSARVTDISSEGLSIEQAKTARFIESGDNGTEKPDDTVPYIKEETKPAEQEPSDNIADTLNTLKSIAEEHSKDDNVTVHEEVPKNKDKVITQETSEDGIKKPDLSNSFKFEMPKRVIKECPQCGMMYPPNTENCPICSCALTVKE